MIHRPVFKPYFHIETVDQEGTFLLSEHGHFVLTGHLNDMIVPLIDGKRTADEIADQLRDKARMEEVYYALVMLEKNGHLTEADDDMAPDSAAFWTALGVDTGIVRDRLAKTRVNVQDLGENYGPALAEMLGRFGISSTTEGQEADFSIVIVNDYLQSELEQINAEHLAMNKPWMLVKPKGFVTWAGPIFVPGVTGCWQCLAQRLRGNREVEAFIERKKGQAGPFPVARAQVPASVEQAINLTALQAAIFVAAGQHSHLTGKIVTVNHVTLATETHSLVRRPQCSACGAPNQYLNSDQIILGDTMASLLQDAGHRVSSPEATFARFQHHVSPITGVVSVLLPANELEDSPLRVYVAGHNFAFKNDSLYFLQDGLRSKSSGKGTTDSQAKTSALCEAIERYSGVYRGEEQKIRAKFRDLGDLGIHPNSCMLFSDRQYEQRLQWLARGSRFQVVPLPFQEDVMLDWTPVHSLTYGVSKYLPTGYLYYGYPIKEEEFFFWADSNGNAAGNTIEEAILQGFLELVERDGVCLWWYNRTRRPMVDLSSMGNPYIEQLRAYYAAHNREFWVLDLTTDTGIPTFAAVNRRIDSPIEDIVLGFGAHLDARVGIMRALTEMNQFMPAVLKTLPDGKTDYAFHDPDALHWWQTATLANQPYLQPLPRPFVRHITDYKSLCSDSVVEDVRTCVRIATALGLEVLVLNQTRPDVELPVAKVIVPGLRHFWARFAPGRLYHTPVQLGWLSAPLPEEYLNPIPMFV